MCYQGSENQPTLFADLQTSFADPHAHLEVAHTQDRHRGRTENRRIRVSCEMNAYLTDRWPWVEQVAEVTHQVSKKASTSEETVSLLTDLPRAFASPARLLQLNRGHWHIENRLHYVREVSFGEDRSQLRTGSAPQVMAALRNLVITLLHRCGSCQIAASRRSFASHPHRALALLFAKGDPQQ